MQKVKTPAVRRKGFLLPFEPNAMKIAVVFDSAGTLLRMYRVAKNVNTGAILNEVISTELVGKKPYCALLVMQIDSNRLEKCPPDMLVSDFIR